MAPPEHGDGEPRLAWRYLAHSEVGKVRKNNQDSGLAGASLLVVADGMGGAAAGDLASAVAVDAVTSVAAELTGTPTASDPANVLTEALTSANTRIADLIGHEPTLDGMGTTATAVVLDGDQLQLAHIGDSRAYRFRDGQLEQLTHDHSWVQSLIDDGRISAAEANVHPHRSLLLKVLNGQPGSTPDVRSETLRLGDRLLLCSDGLCGFVPDEVIRDALTGTDRDEAMHHLIAASHGAGGLDNITIIVADVVDPATDTAGPAPVDDTAEDTSGQDGSPDGAEEFAGPGTALHVLGAAAAHDTASLESNILQRVSVSDRDDEDDDDYEDGAGDHGEDGATVPPGDDEDRYTPQAPGKRRFLKPLIAMVVAFLIIVAAAAVGYAWTRTQYYVGSDGDHVAIYQGIDKRPAGVPLSRVYQVQRLRTDALPRYYQDLVQGTIQTDSLSSARGTVTQLRVAADHCRTTKHRKKSDKKKEAATASPSASPGKHGKHGKDKSPKKDKSSKKHKAEKSSPSAGSAGELPGNGRC